MKESRIKKIALTCNIRSSDAPEEFQEWDEPETVEAIAQSIRLLGFDVCIINCNGKDAEEQLRQFKPDLAFNIAEGLHGESRESEIPLLLEKLEIPYTGSGPQTLISCLNKAKTKEILRSRGVPTPSWFCSESPLSGLPPALTYPLMVKPLFEGSSKGIKNNSLVYNDRELLERTTEVVNTYHQPYIVEEFLTGREFTAAMIGNGDSLEILPVVEINFEELPKDATPIYSYEAKWIWDTVEKPLHIFTCPAKTDSALQKEILDTVKNAFIATGCRDWARIDLRQDRNGKINIIEINPLPGIIPDPDANSCFPKAARAAGLKYGDIVKKVLDAAFKRLGV